MDDRSERGNESPDNISVVGNMSSGEDIVLGKKITTNNVTVSGNLTIVLNGLPGYIPTPDLSSLKKKYLDHLKNTHHAIDFRGISQLNTVNQKIQLEDIYIPLLARPDLPSTEISERQEQRDGQTQTRIDANVRTGIGKGTSITVNVEETLGTYSQILILGHPGSGKSTVLKYIALKLSTQENAPLPILIPLNAYAAWLEKKGDCNLQSYFAEYFKSAVSGFAGLELLFDSAIQQGRAIILLDGLDEILKNRSWIVNKIEMLANDIMPMGNKLLLTSRIDSYRETPLMGDWAVYTLLDFDSSAIEQFALRWCIAVEKATHGDTPEAITNAGREQERLLLEINSKPRIAQLASKPLLLTILALIQRQRMKLPKSRIKLYDIYLETLISTWHQYRPINDLSNVQDYEYEEVVAILGPLALWLREENPSSWLVGEDKLIAWLTNYYRHELGIPPLEARRAAHKFYNDIKLITNIFIEQGEGSVEFIHSTLGEALAAFGLANISLNLDESLDIVQKHILDSGWQEVILLYVETFGVLRSMPKVAGNIVGRILELSYTGENEGRNVLVAGSCLEEVGEQGIGNSVAEKVRQSLLDLLSQSSVLLTTRRDAGFLLGRIGWQPDDLDKFISIKGGPFPKSANQTIVIEDFLMGKYPVTNAQFGRFIEDGGYQDETLWSREGISWLKEKFTDESSTLYVKLVERTKRTMPYFWHDPFWNNPLAPVVGINWFETEAYCKWLSRKNGGHFCLPTEFEWEHAARGSENREYPWGNEYIHSIANTAEVWWIEKTPFNIKQWLHTDSQSRKNASTTIVGQFPESNTPSGISDMAGNVWEWTNSWFDESQTYRVTRGGAWIGKNSYMRCTYRGRNAPINYSNYTGFRVVQHPS
ncbi:MAG TPA: SUMF1/EgtB/PvdO family nonheme iron enzyme [Anaerolineales bacterium]|nr:SUMF1/EgtB/PvdO family nonheme iron enzyme [Anaerolineales bacterium]